MARRIISFFGGALVGAMCALLHIWLEGHKFPGDGYDAMYWKIVVGFAILTGAMATAFGRGFWESSGNLW